MLLSLLPWTSLFCAMWFIVPSQAYDDLALMRYLTKINDYRFRGESYESIRRLMNIYDGDEFRLKHPDYFPLRFAADKPFIPLRNRFTYPTVPEVHDLLMKRFAWDFHKLLYYKFEHRRSDSTYHTLEIVKAILNVPAFETIKLKHEKET